MLYNAPSTAQAEYSNISYVYKLFLNNLYIEIQDRKDILQAKTTNEEYPVSSMLRWINKNVFYPAS